MDIGARIKNRRKKLGLSAEMVADRMGIAPATVYRYESAEIMNMGIDKIQKIADALETTPAYLMGWEDISFPETANNSINIEDELKALLSRIETSTTATYKNKEMNESAKALLKNSLEGLIQNLDLIV